MSELENKKYEKSCKEAEVNDLESQNETLKGLIERLEAAKKIINQSDNDFRDYRWDIKKDYEQYEADWAGDAFEKYTAEIQEEIYESLYETYINDGVNRVLDDICDLITQYENEIYENEGFIGRLKSAINSLANEIEKLINNL